MLIADWQALGSILLLEYQFHWNVWKSKNVLRVSWERSFTLCTLCVLQCWSTCSHKQHWVTIFHVLQSKWGDELVNLCFLLGLLSFHTQKNQLNQNANISAQTGCSGVRLRFDCVYHTEKIAVVTSERSLVHFSRFGVPKYQEGTVRCQSQTKDLSVTGPRPLSLKGISVVVLICTRWLWLLWSAGLP